MAASRSLSTISLMVDAANIRTSVARVLAVIFECSPATMTPTNSPFALATGVPLEPSNDGRSHSVQ
jgi:hypothetical protein